MAVAGSLLTSNINTSSAATFNTASIAPGGNRLILAAIYGVDGAFTTPPTFSLTGNGLTWVSVLRRPIGIATLQVFRAMGASPSAGAVTIDADVATLAFGQWVISEFDGVDTSGTNGSGAVGNVAQNGNSSGVTSLTVTLPAFGSANNGTYGAFSAVNEVSPAAFTFTPGSGFTELAENNANPFGGAAYFGLQAQWKATNDTGVDVSTSVTVEDLDGIALEIVAASAGGGVNGAGDITFPELQVSGAGVRTSKGTGALTLDALQVSGAGKRHAVGSGALTLLPVEVAGEGTVGAAVTGTGAITLEPPTVAGAGVRTSKGAGALTLDALQVSGAGVRESKGSGAIVLDILQVSGAGVRTSKGSGAILFDTLQVDGAGNVFSGIGGSGALTLTPLLVSGAGARTAKGTGAITLPGIEVAGSGTVETPTEGSGALTLLPVEVAGAGVRTSKGTGAIVLPMFQVSGYDVPPTPGGAYQYIGGTAFDAQGRMLTSLLDVEEPVPAGARYLDGVAHDAAGQRYMTTWPGSAAVKFIDGFAMRADGVQVAAPDAAPARALCGIGVTALGETAVTEEAPSAAVGGFGLDAAGRLSVTRKPPAV